MAWPGLAKLGVMGGVRPQPAVRGGLSGSYCRSIHFQGCHDEGYHGDSSLIMVLLKLHNCDHS
jgi:hypothetical protein